MKGYRRKIFFFLFLVLIIIIFLALASEVVKDFGGGVHIPITENKKEIKDRQEGEVVGGITTPEGFSLTFFAKDLPSARVIEFDPSGRMLVSQTKSGKITVLTDADQDGVAEERKVLLEGLNNPHGMVFKCETETDCYLFVAESDKLTRYYYDLQSVEALEPELLVDLPYSSFDNHSTRSLLFLPSPGDNTLLISIGSSCNVCQEKNNLYGTIMSYNLETGLLEHYATGLRNAVFMALNPVDGQVFATEMGRDLLGDDLPPDEINIVEEGSNYGWPICYGKNIHDTGFDKNTYIRPPCTEPFETPSFIDIQAHSAPLGLAFIPEEGWPEDYWYDILVAYHGSWNRSVPTGYKIARIKMNANGKYLGSEDFITGWLKGGNRKIGRPVDVKIFPGGVAYITDDLAGVVYKLRLLQEPR